MCDDYMHVFGTMSNTVPLHGRLEAPRDSFHGSFVSRCENKG